MNRRLIAYLVAYGFDRSRPLADGGVAVRCSHCNACVINGLPSHETTCPNARHQCRGCNELIPATRHFCPACLS